jgi:hypothetical protein
MTFHVPEPCRITKGPMGSTADAGCNGAFQVRLPSGVWVNVIASDGGGWEHVSVSIDYPKAYSAFSRHCPRWEDMCAVKVMFWGPEDVVLQYHPRESEYVNCHPFTLHLWRPVGIDIPTPPSIMVGPR